MNNSFAVATVVIKEMYRRKGLYVLFILTVLITLVLASINIFGDGKIIRHLKELCLLLIWISSLVIAITATARQLPAERESRTIFPLLAKPVTRNQVLLGKFLGCWLACGLALLVFYLFFGVITASREQGWSGLGYLQAIGLHWFMLAIVVAMSLLGSVIFAAPSSNATICFIVATGILLLGRHLGKVALQLPEPGHTLLYTLYFVIPHLEFFDMRDLIIHNWEPVPLLVWLGALGYAIVYTSFLLVPACLIFRQQPLNT